MRYLFRHNEGETQTKGVSAKGAEEIILIKVRVTGGLKRILESFMIGIFHQILLG
jgi:hypothetical protein